jgi:nucleoside-diphosphate-sugar epimerase
MYETLEKYPDTKIVYFSTCSMYDPSVNKSLYVAHKLSMETLIQSIASKYLIIRTTNLVGRSDNPNLLMNFFVNKIRSREKFEVWTKAVRNIIDIDNFHEVVCGHIGEENKVLNIFNSNSYPVPGIVKAIERHLKIRAITKEVERGSDFVIKGIGLKFNEGDYLGFLLQKYYPVYVKT